MTGSALERIITVLEQQGHRVKREGRLRARTTCTHPGADNPTGLGLFDNGSRVQLTCFTHGCDGKEIVESLGLTVRDLYHQPRTTYVYDDGRRVHRDADPKQFRQSGNTKAAPTLYRLGSVREAVANNEVIFLVEGEEDVHSLETLDVTATTTPMGAANIGKCDLSPLFNARVIAVVDKDEAGAKWAEHVRKQLPRARFRQAKTGKDASDHIAAGHGLDDFEELPERPGTSAEASQPREASVRPEQDDKRSAAARLVDLALDRYRFGVTPEGEPFGVPLAGGHVVRMLRGSRTSLRAELASVYRRETGRIAAQQALADALLVLEGEAQGAEPEQVHLRVAEAHGQLWIDLGDAAETAVRIGAGSWVVTKEVPVLFRRSALTGAMPIPAPGDLADLWQLLNVAEADRPLVLGWLVAALGAPTVPHPILALFGEQGTGKSTASKLLIDLVDPSPVPLRKPPRDMDSWVTAAAGSWVVGLDNLSAVPDWLSDTLCRAATGDGDVRRQLYTDSGLAVFAFRRVLLLNGIDLGGLRGDLTERLLAVRLDAIPDAHRRTERDLAAAWAEARPRLLGALLGEVARMTSQLPYVRLGTAPRMADFAIVLAALDGTDSSTGLGRYLEQARSLSADSLTADPFVTTMMASIASEFVGRAAQLLDLVTPDDRPPRGWPTTARQVTTSLRRNAPALRRQGWQVEDLGAANRENSTIWRIVPPEIAGIPSSSASRNSPTGARHEVTRQTSQKSGPSQDDDTKQQACTGCGQPLDPAVAADGFTTHPTCGPAS